MKKAEDYLPLEFKSANSVPVTSVLVSREKMLEIIARIIKDVKG